MPGITSSASVRYGLWNWRDPRVPCSSCVATLDGSPYLLMHDDLIVDGLLSVAPDAVIIDPDILQSYRDDQAHAVRGGTPVAVVRARSTAEVRAVVQVAEQYSRSIVVRGAGTGLSGGAAATDGCIILSTERMRRIDVDAHAMTVTAQPGALNIDVKRAARDAGLWYPPDPSSYETCSIGGNVATNAGGACCLKYGVTGDYVLGLEVVLADATVVRLGGRTIKDVAGYDLKRLFVGSEGSLGIVTEVTLRVRPVPPPPATLVATFPDVGSAGAAATAILSLVRIAALELMDRATVRAVDELTKMDLDADAGALLIAQSDAGGSAAEAELDLVSAACSSAGATFVAHTADEAEGDQLMAVRRMALPAVERLGHVLIEDVGVPLDRIADLLTGIEWISARRDVLIATFGHAGDGNFHPVLVFDRDDAGATARAELAFGDVMRLAIRLGGTITGEHGVGQLKQPWLADQVGEDVLQLVHRLKFALDPSGILNPGRAI